MTFQFDWQKRNEDFVKWMFVHLVADQRSGDPKFEKLSEATNHFTEVKLTIQVNGIEVNAQNFIESVQNAYTQHAENAARQLVEETIPDFYELREAVDTAQRALTEKLRTAMESAGVHWPEEY